MRNVVVPSLLVFAAAIGLMVPAAEGAEGPPSISVHPANKNVLQGLPASFSVTADGTAPLTYQWRRGGVDIGGATSSTYTIPVTTASDNNVQFTVVIANNLGMATSNPALLLVDPGSLVVTTTNVIPISSQNWRYLTNGSDQGTAWTNTAFADSAWNLGQALFGFETTPTIYAEPFRSQFTAYTSAIVT